MATLQESSDELQLEKLKKLDRVIELAIKKVSLLKELKLSMEVESCSHEICKIIGTTPSHQNYVLIEIKTQKQITAGSMNYIIRYIERHNIDKSKVFTNE
jgi:hypothetical protein